MTDEVVVADVEAEVDEAAEAAELESGYANEPTEVTPPAGTEDTAAVPAVKYRQVTEEEWSALQGTSTQIEKVRADSTARLDQAFGKVGGIERALKELQAATPSGYNVDVTDDIVADLKTEFPEIGDLTLKALKSFAGKLKGTAPAGIDPAKFEEQVATTVTGRLRAIQTEALEDEYPAWRETIGPKDSDTPYRKWLATQPAEYSAKLSSTESATVIARSIAKFEAAAAKAVADAAAAAAVVKKPAVSARQQRLEAAAIPKGAGGSPPGPSDDDQFVAGYTSG